jgi:hypothetical protein
MTDLSGSLAPKLNLPKEGTWDVFVTSISSETIWIRLIGDNYDVRFLLSISQFKFVCRTCFFFPNGLFYLLQKKYNEVMNDMELSLLSNDGQVATSPVVDRYYAVKFDNCWCRVQLREIIPAADGEDQSAVVFLIDNGDEDTVSLNELRVLKPEYLSIPPQVNSEFCYPLTFGPTNHSVYNIV